MGRRGLLVHVGVRCRTEEGASCALDSDRAATCCLRILVGSRRRALVVDRSHALLTLRTFQPCI